MVGRRLSQRFTTLEGWREVGSGVFAMGSSNIRMFAVRHQFDTDNSSDIPFDFTQTLDNSQAEIANTQSFVEYRRSSEGTIGKAIGSVRDGKNMSTIGTVPDGKDLPTIQEMQPEAPYYAYTVHEKWTLVAIAGAASSFPMLTFNMYLPALERIATVGFPIIPMSSASLQILGVRDQHRSCESYHYGLLAGPGRCAIAMGSSF